MLTGSSDIRTCLSSLKCLAHLTNSSFCYWSKFLNTGKLRFFFCILTTYRPSLFAAGIQNLFFLLQNHTNTFVDFVHEAITEIVCNIVKEQEVKELIFRIPNSAATIVELFWTGKRDVIMRASTIVTELRQIMVC